MSFWAPFFSNQSMLSTIFAQIFREFAYIFREFVKLAEILPGFKEFCRDFHQIKTFWGALSPLHPRLLHLWLIFYSNAK